MSYEEEFKEELDVRGLVHNITIGNTWTGGDGIGVCVEFGSQNDFYKGNTNKHCRMVVDNNIKSTIEDTYAIALEILKAI